MSKCGFSLSHKKKIHSLLEEGPSLLNSNNNHAYKNKTIHQIFEEQAKRTPHRMAVVFGEESLTYQELNNKANQFAHFLRDQAVNLDVLVGVMLERSVEFIISIVGILKAGGAYVPIDPFYPEKRIQYKLKDAGIKLLITHSSFKNKLEHYRKKVIFFDKKNHLFERYSKRNPSSLSTPSSLAYVIYTSGSMGAPKGVMIEHKGICNLVYFQLDELEITSNSRILQFASINFDASVWEIFSALSFGASLYIPSEMIRKDVKLLINYILEHDISIATLPPALLTLFPKKPIPSLTTLVIAGETCGQNAIDYWSNNTRLINAYGPTEVTVCATTYACEGNSPANIIGKPINNIRIYILDPELQPVAIEQIGEIYIGGVGVARGYLNNHTLTSEKFISNPFDNDDNRLRDNDRLYKTGDLGKWLKNGNIEFKGRVDLQIKLRGFRIEIEEIEIFLRNHSLVQNCMVSLNEKKKGRRYLIAYVVPEIKELSHQEALCLSKKLKEDLAKNLPGHMIPKFFVYLKGLPLNLNGKLDRSGVCLSSKKFAHLLLSTPKML